ncbi:head GIN domain-containing protein [Pontixanthobacter aquaemixtae]|uniref:DUF2807 domain-containing protein n=1 Tax=Pontixanthobacter aquaemixtae TaxID=1958940 RepID=A0A844ZXB3_9SPHN|nr:head GIN domain-containing protein [Pontixanthobacter aquaemixtae]MXO91397.1 DUF2807 domain-containing protein [Pontixanthobacter aquaemixtae]
MNVNIGDSDGVPLAELDQSGDPPTELVMAGPDKIIITDGDELSIEVEGDDDAVADLRFSLEGGKLAISRKSESWGKSQTATVRVTMPSPEELVIAGSGTVEAQSLARDAEISIGGSGNVTIATIDADRLNINVGGSGSVKSTGSVDRLDVNIGGSGNIDFSEVQVDRAEINIGGNGNLKFASDGTVEANIMGSGSIDVVGSAECKLNAFGSGKLNCKPVAEGSDDAPEADVKDGDEEA